MIVADADFKSLKGHLRPGVRLLPGDAGAIEFQGGPFPERFVVAFDPAGSPCGPS